MKVIAVLVGILSLLQGLAFWLLSINRVVERFRSIMHVKVKTPPANGLMKVVMWKLRMLGLFHIVLGLFLFAIVFALDLLVSVSPFLLLILLLIPYAISTLLGFLALSHVMRRKSNQIHS